MESETETENYKNMSMPPSARLEENKKKEPFSSAATGSLSAVISGTSSPESAILSGFQPSISQAGLNTHRQERAEAARRQEGQAPRSSPLGTQALGLFWGTCPRGPVPPSGSHTSHPSLCKCPPCHTVTQVLPSFPDMTSKELRGSLEVLACWLPVPCGQCPRLLPSSRLHPRAGLPASLAPGPPAIIPAPL